MYRGSNNDNGYEGIALEFQRDDLTEVIKQTKILERIAVALERLAGVEDRNKNVPDVWPPYDH